MNTWYETARAAIALLLMTTLIVASWLVPLALYVAIGE